jgi:hypothetical protein
MVINLQKEVLEKEEILCDGRSPGDRSTLWMRGGVDQLHKSSKTISFFYLLKYRLPESGNVCNKSNSFNLDGISLSFVSNEQVLDTIITPPKHHNNTTKTP